MRLTFPLLCALVITANQSIAQNEIDYVNSYYWSGYGKMAIDHDTLYLNSLNGAGVERYYIADPANPQFIDRTQVSGFDQIDFERRLMADFRGDRIFLIDFGDFDNALLVSTIGPAGEDASILNWKLHGEHVLVITNDDTIRAYDISDPSMPILVGLCGSYDHGDNAYYHHTIFGTTVMIQLYHAFVNNNRLVFLDLYDIWNPNDISFVRSDMIAIGPASSYDMQMAKGDTVAEAVLLEGVYGFLRLVSYAPGDSANLPSWDAAFSPPSFFNADLGFIVDAGYPRVMRAYSYDDFTNLGRVQSPISNYLEFTDNSYLIFALPESLKIFQPTYSDLIMPQVGILSLAHFGILSCAAYGNYVLSGAESNGGELLIHELGQDEQLELVATLPGVESKGIIIDGSSALCLCPDKIVQVGLTDPSAPVIRHELTGFGQELLDFALEDSLLFVISDRTFYVIDYDSLAGMQMASTLEFAPGSLTSMDNYYTASIVLKGNEASLVKISALDPANPQIVAERQLRPDTFQNVEIMYATIWASGRHGTDVLNVYSMDSVAFFGPEYFSDVRGMYIKPDTLIIADGSNGLKVFDFEFYPYGQLHYIGGYSTGNVVRQVATIGDNFFLGDYYSLQHLRWGAPTGVLPDDENPLPNEIALYQNYPNPFNAQTTIEYYLPKAGPVKIEIFDILGKKVETLVHAHMGAGRHTVLWDAGERSSGVYFYRILAGEKAEVRKCLLLK